jgi:hypothetical protein
MKNCQILFLISSLFLVSSGCAYNSERSAKMATSGPKHTHAQDEQWFAQCKTPGGHTGTWRGPVRTAKEWAIRDAGDHEKEFPGHRATIEH